jgi:hypothetical protein
MRFHIGIGYAIAALAIFGTIVAGSPAVIGSAAPPPDPVQVAPTNYKVMFENDRVRVLSFHAQPGDAWGLHAHPDAVVISLGDYVVRNVVPGSPATERTAHRGDAAWIPARSHTGENTGGTAMDCILVELKEPAH